MELRTWIAAGAAAAGLAVFAAGLPAAAQVHESTEQRIRGLEADLEARGFEVARGEWRLFEIEDCQFAMASMGFCMGNNPAAPYLIPTVPHWDDEFSDEHLRDLLGPTTRGNWWTYRLDEREALVVLGHLPPPGAYFSLITYVFTREGTPDTSQPLYKELTDPFIHRMVFLASPNPSRAIVFSSIGDSNNSVVIERQSGTAFDQERFFVISPDAGMERELTEALLRAGVPDRSHVLAERLSPELARIGLGREADDFMTLLRYAEPDDDVAGDAWRQQLPLAVLRVRDMNAGRAAEPHPVPTRDERVGRSERELADDLDGLVQAVKERWGQSGATDGEFVSLLHWIDLLGEHCLQNTRNCLGDNSDADYQISPTVSLDAGEVLAVVGTLGTETGNATYVSLSVNWLPPLVGILNVSDDELKGTAAAFAGAGDSTDSLYLQYFARDCTGLENCVAVTEEMIPRGGSLKIVQRNYVVPGRTRGTDPNVVMNPVLIVLDGASRPRGG
jgi:hypothetical protein